jgi:uncharacterized membrane protein YqgA involved in biofilm formation
MTGTLINAATVIVGSTLGTFLRSRFPDRVRQIVMWGVELISLVIGLQMSLNESSCRSDICVGEEIQASASSF